MSEPTKAAMRAAVSLLGGTRVLDSNLREDVRRDAEIIDRATGLPQLVEAIKWYLANDDTIEYEDNQFWLDGRNQAIAALRKAGEL